MERLGTSNATSLQARVNMANAWPADYFLSIHCNASTNPDINGSEVYVYREGTQAYWLAQHILKALVKSVGTRDNGVRLNPSLYVLRRTRMPAALVELAYLTNVGDAAKAPPGPGVLRPGASTTGCSAISASTPWGSAQNGRDCQTRPAAAGLWAQCFSMALLIRAGISLFSRPRAKASSSWSLSSARRQ